MVSALYGVMHWLLLLAGLAIERQSGGHGVTLSAFGPNLGQAQSSRLRPQQ
jgi:hypothetical protein